MEKAYPVIAIIAIPFLIYVIYEHTQQNKKIAEISEYWEKHSDMSVGIDDVSIFSFIFMVAMPYCLMLGSVLDIAAERDLNFWGSLIWLIVGLCMQISEFNTINTELEKIKAFKKMKNSDKHNKNKEDN